VHQRPSGLLGTEVLKGEAVLEQLERILASEDFDASPRSRDFVRFIVEETLAGRGDDLTQAAIATRVFGRREDFDPTVDPIVRIQAGRLRRSLERYYLLSGGSDPVRIELPRGAYVPLVRWLQDARERAQQEDTRQSRASDGWPSVVVSLFESHPASELDDVAGRFEDALCVEMGRYGDVLVVRRRELDQLGRSQAEAGGFALSGRISCSDEGPRVGARLVDTRDATQVWAEDYRGEPGSSAAFFDETARVVAARVASEQGVVAQRLWAEQRMRGPEELTSYGAILLSYKFFFNRDPEELRPAVLALRRTVHERPECQLAWVQLARLSSTNYAFELTDLATPIEDAIGFVQKAIQLDPASQRARAALAGAFLIQGELGAGRAEAEKAYAINPDSLTYLEWIGWLLALLGDWERGVLIIRRAMARNPHHIPVALHAIWADHLRRGELEEAYQEAVRVPEPIFFWRALMRACSLGLLGRSADARLAAAELLRSKPGFEGRARALIGRYIKFPELVERIVEGLRAAGLAID
jgi:adenylate cyclase